MPYYKDYTVPNWTIPLGQIEVTVNKDTKITIQFFKDKDSDWMFSKIVGKARASVRSKTWANLLTLTGQVIKDLYENYRDN